LVVGTLLLWIPVIDTLGSLLVLVGVVLVILGRQAFGQAHSRNIIVAIVAFLIGIVALLLVSATFDAVLTSAFSARDRMAVAPAVRTALTGIVVAGIIMGLAWVFLTYALQNRLGQILLWVGYGATVLIQIVVSLLLVDAMTSTLEYAVSSGTTRPSALNDLMAERPATAVWRALPLLLFAAAYYLARARIQRAEIPMPPRSGGG
jgi:hypothetical protein